MPAPLPNAASSYPRYMPIPRRNLLNLQPSVMLPQRSKYLYPPKKSIAFFARRNPYYTQQPKVLANPRQNAIIASRRGYMYAQRPRYMYNPRQFYRNVRPAFAYARNYMYPQQRRYVYSPRAPVAYRQAVLRSRTPRVVFRTPGPVYAFRRNQQTPSLYGRQYSVTGNHLNLNTGTGSHTMSHSILKAPGHTSTDTHVLNKQQTGGKVRGVAALKGRKATPVLTAKYPFMYKGSKTRGRVSASAKVNAKASASSASSSKSSSSSNSNAGSRTASGGWGGGAGAGWGTGQNAWGIGYGGGGGGSNWNIPSGMIGIPGMPGKFPGIPQGFPGMPSGGYPSSQSKGSYAGAQARPAKKPSSTIKGKKITLKPNKGLDATKAYKAVKGKNTRPKVPVKNLTRKMKTYAKKPAPKSMFPVKSYNPGQLYRVQFFTSDPMHRPASQQWQNIRQKIIADVMRN